MRVYLRITLDERQTPFTASVVPRWQTAEIFVKPYVLAHARARAPLCQLLVGKSERISESLTDELTHASKKENEFNVRTSHVLLSSDLSRSRRSSGKSLSSNCANPIVSVSANEA